MTTATIEQLASVMADTVQKIQELTGANPENRESTALLIINLTNSFMLSNLERAEIQYPGLSAELLKVIHDMTNSDSAFAQRLQWINKRQ